jgi:hypothetical protein
VVWEGTLPYYGALTQFLAPGNAINIAGSGYTTGWESLNLPIVSIELGFLNGNTGTSYSTVLHLSNRRGRYSPAAFLRPNMQHGQYQGGGPAIGARGIVWGEMAAVSGETIYSEEANAAAEDYRQKQAADAAAQAPYQSRYATAEQLDVRDQQRQARQDQAAMMRQTLDRARRAEVARQRREGIGPPKGPGEVIGAMPPAASRLEETDQNAGLTPMPGGEGEPVAANP